ncbi:hypothetical protein OBBRIDRAFT_887559 [Obba rivulosa]|uniref:Homeobox domain-containing protein n=1 Tax=Obba rivulosa TaxID=1052685 RepID=A0A8E2DNN9_9APHY|nr:hypothetical protein OBBRIDRAFT_887559 [Obba rivulosa]
MANAHHGQRAEAPQPQESAVGGGSRNSLSLAGKALLNQYFAINPNPSNVEQHILLNILRSLPECDWYDKHRLSSWFSQRRKRDGRARNTFEALVLNIPTEVLVQELTRRHHAVLIAAHGGPPKLPFGEPEADPFQMLAEHSAMHAQRPFETGGGIGWAHAAFTPPTTMGYH